MTMYGFQIFCDVSSVVGYAPIWEMGVSMALYGDATTPQVFRGTKTEHTLLLPKIPKPTAG